MVSQRGNIMVYRGNQGRIQDFGKGVGGENHGERGSANLYGGLGAMPLVGSRGKAPGQGG